jgi:hypothetical protein
LERVLILLENTFVVSLLCELYLVLFIELVELLLVLLGDRLDQEPIVSPAAVLKQNGENFPDARDYCVLLLRVGEHLLDQLVKANRIYEQCSIDPVDIGVIHICSAQSETIDAVSVDWWLVLWSQNYARDVQVLCILKRFINPVFEYFGAHLHLTVFRSESGLILIASRLGNCQVATDKDVVFTALPLL